jgi:hypothetical protein
VNTPEIGDTTRDFYDPNMLSANMGARVDAVKMLGVGGVRAGKPQLRRLKTP